MRGNIVTKLFFYTVLICLCPLALLAQQTKIDSLETLLKQHTKQDTVRVGLLLGLAKLNLNRDFKKMGYYAEMANNLSDILNYKKGKTGALRYMAIDLAIKSNHIGALSMAKEALEISKLINDPNEIVENLSVIGSCHFRIGNYYKALHIYQKALAKSEEIKNRGKIVDLFVVVASIHIYFEKYDIAMDYCQKGLKIAIDSENKTQESLILNNISQIYLHQENFPEALSAIKKALILAEEMDVTAYIGDNLISAGNIYAKMGNSAKAIELYEEGVAISREVDSKYYLSEGLLGLASLKNDLGYFNTAKKLVDEVQLIADINNFHVFKMQSYRILSDIYSSLNNHKNAYDQYKAYKKLSDSIFNKKAVGEINALEQKYLLEKENHLLDIKDNKESALKESALKEKSQLRNISIVGGVVLILLACIIFINLTKKRAIKSKLAAQRKKIEVEDATIANLEKFKKDILNTIESTLKEPLRSLAHPNEANVGDGLTETKKTGEQLLERIQAIINSNNSNYARKYGKHQLSTIVASAIGMVSNPTGNKGPFIENHIDSRLRVFCHREPIKKVITTLLQSTLGQNTTKEHIVVNAIPTGNQKIKIKIGLKERTPLGQIIAKNKSDISRSKDQALEYCRLAVERQGGSLHLENKKNNATAFVITLSTTETPDVPFVLSGTDQENFILGG